MNLKYNIMKRILLRYIVFLVLFGLALPGMGQSICEKCKPCQEAKEGAEEGAEEGDFTADIGEEGAEMGVEEGEMLGTEAGEEAAEVGAEAGAEVVAELTAEGLASAALDAIPAVGEIFMVAEALYFLISGILNIKHEMELKKEHETANILSSGNFRLPLVPHFSMSADDHNGQRDTVSYLIFLKKNIDADDIKNYLKESGQDTHIGKSYSLKKLNDHMAYAFSSFNGVSKKKDQKGGKLGIHYPPRNFEPITARFDIVAWNYYFKSTWEHKVSHQVKDWYERCKVVGTGLTGTAYVSCQKYEKRIGYSLTRKMQLHNYVPIEFWLSTKTDKGTFVHLKKIPKRKVHIQDIGDQLAVRIIDVPLVKSAKPLYITMPYAPYENHVEYTVKGKKHKAFPENWNPLEPVSGYVNSVYKGGKTTYSYVAFRDAGIYPNTQNLVPKKRKGLALFAFRIHDYQPRDTDKSALKKKLAGKGSEINGFPTISTSGKTQYEKGTVPNPRIGYSNIRIDMPLNSVEKPIDYIEIDVMSNHHMIIVDFYDPNSKETINQGSFIKATSRNKEGIQPLRIRQLTKYDINTPNPKEHVVPNNRKMEFTPKNHSFLLLNAPIGSRELINVSVFYSDGSLSRNVLLTGTVNNNVFNRAYYQIRSGSKYLGNNNGLGFYNTSQSDWLIEYQGNISYAIMHRETKEVLGILHDQVGLYDWDYSNDFLHWIIKPKGDKFVLYNLGQEAFLSVGNPETPPGFTTDIADAFTITKIAKTEPILTGKEVYLVNRYTDKVLAINNGLPSFEKRSSNVQRNVFEYHGCLRYSIYNPYRQKYLQYNYHDKLQWGDDVDGNWLVTNLKARSFPTYYNITHDGNPLYYNSSLQNNIGVSLSQNPPLEEDGKYQFHINKPPSLDEQLVLHYKLDDNANDYSSHRVNGIKHSGVDIPPSILDPVRGKVALFSNNNSFENYIDTRRNLRPKQYWSEDMTISMWVKTLGGTLWNDHEPVLIRGDAFSLQGHVDGTVRAAIYTSPTRKKTISGAGVNINDGQWHHIVQVIDGQGTSITMKLYIDGSFISENTVSGVELFSQGNSTIIGRDFNGQFKYSGYLDDVKVWMIALTDEEIEKEYNPQRLDKLIAHYTFEGTTYDASTYQNHGTNYGNVSYAYDTTLLPIESGRNRDIETQSVQFGANGSYMSAPVKVPATEYTLSLWFKTNKETGSIYYSTSKGGQKITQSIYLNSGKIYVQMGSQPETFESSKYNDGQWHHLVYTRGASVGGQRLYVDGAEQIFEPRIHTATTSTAIFLGDVKKGYPTTNFEGRMDNVKIWSKALTAKEVSDEFNAYLHTYCRPQRGSQQGKLFLRKVSTVDALSDIHYTENSYHGAYKYETAFPLIVEQNSTFELNVELNEKPSRYSIVKAWIDWNGDGSFDNIYEGISLLVNDEIRYSPDADLVKAIHVPASAKLGLVRMRIRYTNLLGRTMTPCGTLNNAVTYDYSVRIVKEPVKKYCQPEKGDQQEALYFKSVRTEGAVSDIYYREHSYIGAYKYETKHPITLEQNSTFELTAEISKRSRFSFVKAWIDWNGDGHFNNDNEEAITLLINDNVYLPKKAIKVPASAKLGPVRMRIRYTNTYGHELTPCGTLNNTVTYDCNVIIVKSKYIKKYCISTDSTGSQKAEIHILYTTDATKDLIYTGDLAPVTGYNYLNSSLEVVQGGTFGLDISHKIDRLYKTKAWIDWNGDMDFDDPGEEIFHLGSSKNPLSDDKYTHMNASITVPLTAQIGTTRMRIRYVDRGSSTLPVSCGHMHNSTTYDFDIKVLESSPENQPLENLAANKPAKQSSLYGTSHLASKAVNKKVLGYHYDITHTQYQHQPWWEVDLGRLADISTIKVFNRLDCCRDRLKNYNIFVSETPFTFNKVSDIKSQGAVDQFYHSGPTDYYSVTNVNKIGRYVRIQLQNDGFLSLSEVQVLGTFIIHDNLNPTSIQEGVESLNDSPDSPIDMVLFFKKLNGDIDVHFNLNKMSTVDYRIINLLGHVVQSDNKLFHPGNQIWNISTDRLFGGLYIIVISSDEWKESRKIVINR